jgi:hypothetical protein
MNPDLKRFHGLALGILVGLLALQSMDLAQVGVWGGEARIKAKGQVIAHQADVAVFGDGEAAEVPLVTAAGRLGFWWAGIVFLLVLYQSRWFAFASGAWALVGVLGFYGYWWI